VEERYAREEFPYLDTYEREVGRSQDDSSSTNSDDDSEEDGDGDPRRKGKGKRKIRKILLADVIRKCWMEEFESADEVAALVHEAIKTY